MGQKDISEKLLADYNDVFADILNVLLFNGEEVVSPDNLQDTKLRSQYKTDDGRLHEQERDVSKLIVNENIKVVLAGLEHQTKIEPDMPLRCFNYDGAAYRSQLLNRDEKDRYAVATIILYFGEKRWNENLSLKERIRVNEKWDPYVNDYRIHVFEIAYLSDEQVRMFKSDFGIVADFFVQRRKNKQYIPSQKTIRHVDEVLKFLSVFTNDERYERAAESCKQEGGQTMTNMRDVLDKVEERGFSEGEKKGFSDGQKNGMVKGKILAFHEVGWSDERIAKKLSCTIEQVQECLNSALQTI